MAVREAEPVGSFQEVMEVGLDREDLLVIYRNMLVTRGIEERGHILYKQGKIPGSFYTGRGNEASAVGIATAMAPNDVGADPARHGRPRDARCRALADLCAVHGARRRPGAWTRWQCPHRRREARAPRDGEPSPRDASGRRRDGARISHSRGAPGRDRLDGRRRGGAGRCARGNELRRGARAPGGLRHRQQPVGLLDADPPRVRV